MKSNYLVCYDIADPKRLNKIFRFMKSRCVHLQYSVFLCRLSWEELNRIKQDLEKLVDGEEDDLRIYPLPSEPLVEVIGCGDRVPENVFIYLE